MNIHDDVSKNGLFISSLKHGIQFFIQIKVKFDPVAL